MALCQKLNKCLIQAVPVVRCATGFQLSSRSVSSTTCLNTRTHTGQEFAEDDFRNVRFENKRRLVNEKFAINLINEAPPKDTKSRVVWCDGGSGPTGHPRVYINLDKPGNHACKYCGLRFHKDDHH